MLMNQVICHLASEIRGKKKAVLFRMVCSKIMVLKHWLNIILSLELITMNTFLTILTFIGFRWMACTYILTLCVDFWFIQKIFMNWFTTCLTLRNDEQGKVLPLQRVEHPEYLDRAGNYCEHSHSQIFLFDSLVHWNCVTLNSIQGPDPWVIFSLVSWMS